MNRLWVAIGIALLMTTSLVQAEWGKLFFSPAERRAINQDSPSSPTASPQLQPQPQPQPQPQRYTGYIVRENGKTVHWIDGAPDVKAPPGAVKPGETWDPTTGQVYPAGRRP